MENPRAWENVRKGFKKIWGRLSLPTRGALVVMLIVVPDWISRGNFWYDFGVRSWPFIKHAYDSSLGKLALIVLAFLVIWLDQIKITRQLHERPSYDLTTLRGRTLQLRDAIKAYWDSVGPPPAPQFEGEHQVGYIKRVTEGNNARASKLIHGYGLRCASDVLRTYHEYGERGWSDTELMDDVIARPYKNEACYKTLVNSLGRLAEHTELLEAALTWDGVISPT